MKPRIYIETSVISCLTSRPSADAIVLARQQRTHELWSLFGLTCEPFISSLVTEEISRGDVNAAARRIEACRDCASFTVTDAARSPAKHREALDRQRRYTRHGARRRTSHRNRPRRERRLHRELEFRPSRWSKRKAQTSTPLGRAGSRADPDCHT